MGERKFRVNKRDSMGRAGGYAVRGFSHKKKTRKRSIRQETKRIETQQNYEKAIIFTEMTLTQNDHCGGYSHSILIYFTDLFIPLCPANRNFAVVSQIA